MRVGLAEAAMGEAIGRVYVERHFPPAAKEAMDVLVANLIEAYRQSIAELEWMSPETRERALAKLAAFTPKIGYPVKWKDYSALEIDPTDVVGNIRRSHVVEHDRQLDKIGKPIDRDEWYMTPQTVNAYYNPLMNEIVFPAAILQYPFFDADRDAAANYGGIGAVIGHEIGHGFDDQGSRFDGDGSLRDWWTDADRTAFEERTSVLIAQFSALVPQGLAEENKVNGALTIGENIGDLGGLGIALKAYELASGDRSLSVDGRFDRLSDPSDRTRDRGVHRHPAPPAELGTDLAAEGPGCRDHPPADHRPAFAQRVPLQPDRPQHRRVLRCFRRHRRGRPLAAGGSARHHLVTLPPPPDPRPGGGIRTIATHRSVGSHPHERKHLRGHAP